MGPREGFAWDINEEGKLTLNSMGWNSALTSPVLFSLVISMNRTAPPAPGLSWWIALLWSANQHKPPFQLLFVKYLVTAMKNTNKKFSTEEWGGCEKVGHLVFRPSEMVSRKHLTLWATEGLTVNRAQWVILAIVQESRMPTEVQTVKLGSRALGGEWGCYWDLA